MIFAFHWYSKKNLIFQQRFTSPTVKLQQNPANIYLLKVSNRETGKRCEICSKLTMKTPERCHDVILVFLVLTLNIFHTFFSVSIVDFE